MSKDKIISLEKPEGNEDLLTGMLRAGARELIMQAVQAELSSFLSQHEEKTDEQGRPLVVRNGYLPERKIMTGLGPVEIQVPKTRDRSGQKIHFRSELLPPYIKRTQSVETVLPWLYLKGVSTGDFSEALSALLGKDAKGLSPGTISRLKQCWVNDMIIGGPVISRRNIMFISGRTVFISMSGVMMRGIASWFLSA